MHKGENISRATLETQESIRDAEWGCHIMLKNFVSKHQQVKFGTRRHALRYYQGLLIFALQATASIINPFPGISLTGKADGSVTEAHL